MIQIDSNLAHLCNGCAIAYFFLRAQKVRRDCGDSYIRRMLGNVLYFWSLLQLKDIVFLNEDWWYDGYISGIVKMVDMTLIPVLFIFFQSCVRPYGLRKIEKLLYMLGNVVFIVLYILFPSDRIFGMGMIYSFLLGLVAYVSIWRECRRKEKHIEENYSYVEGISPQWIMRSLSALFICLVSWEIIFWKDTWLKDSMFYLITIVIWGYIERQAMNKREIEDWQGVAGTDSPQEEPQTGLEEPDKTSIYLELMQRLDRLMAEEKLYLDPHLNISSLALALGTNRTYLSACLNGQLGKTFYDYINDLRLDHAVRLMKNQDDEENRHCSFKEIAEKSGFNSISTFNRQFHTRYGMSPSKWLQENP